MSQSHSNFQNRNIYEVIKILQELVLFSDYLKPKQKEFLNFLLKGNNQTWLGLEKSARLITRKKLNFIIQQIKEEAIKTSSDNKYFLKVLNTLMKDIQTFADKEQKLMFKPESSKKYDDFYKLTQSYYDGVIVLPILQSKDYRLGKSEGECFGYFAEWSKSILNNHKPFGVDMKQSPPFKIINFISALGKRHPELNHLAILTENISKYQRSQTKDAFLTLKEFSDAKITSQLIVKDSFLKSTDEVADQLLSLSVKGNNVYRLSIMQVNENHTMGFYLDKGGRYHFLDANVGWFRFETAQHFKTWFTFFFKKLKYDQKYYGYRIFSLGKNQPLEPSASTSFFSVGPSLFYYQWKMKNFMNRISVPDRVSELKNEKIDSKPLAKYSNDDLSQDATKKISPISIYYKNMADMLNISPAEAEDLANRAASNPVFISKK